MMNDWDGNLCIQCTYIKGNTLTINCPIRHAVKQGYTIRLIKKKYFCFLLTRKSRHAIFDILMCQELTLSVKFMLKYNLLWMRRLSHLVKNCIYYACDCKSANGFKIFKRNLNGTSTWIISIPHWLSRMSLKMHATKKNIYIKIE